MQTPHLKTDAYPLATKEPELLTPRLAGDRGRADFGWLDSRHTFSFGQYHDPAHMGFGPLRVINDDRVAPGGGFPTHPHRDMEIITYVLEGALEHRDSLGVGSVIGRGDVQRMSAGTGIRHSEFNASQTEPVHFLQIWILPDRDGLAPSYQQKNFGDPEKRGQFRLIAARDGRDGAVVMHRDVDLYAALVGPSDTLRHCFEPGRIAWLHVARGCVRLDDQEFNQGDGVAIRDASGLTLAGVSAEAEILLFDMPA
jgi:redox-sensitive bicupin YhaK (pirin superfamily)